MNATVLFHLSTDGNFEVDIDKDKVKEYTLDDFIQYLYDNFIEKGQYYTDEAIVDFGEIDFEDGEIVFF